MGGCTEEMNLSKPEATENPASGSQAAHCDRAGNDSVGNLEVVRGLTNGLDGSRLAALRDFVLDGVGPLP